MVEPMYRIKSTWSKPCGIRSTSAKPIQNHRGTWSTPWTDSQRYIYIWSKPEVHGRITEVHQCRNYVANQEVHRRNHVQIHGGTSSKPCTDSWRYIIKTMYRFTEVHHQNHADSWRYIGKTMYRFTEVHHQNHVQIHGGTSSKPCTDSRRYIIKTMYRFTEVHHQNHVQIHGGTSSKPCTDSRRYIIKTMYRFTEVHHQKHAKLADTDVSV